MNFDTVKIVYVGGAVLWGLVELSHNVFACVQEFGVLFCLFELRLWTHAVARALLWPYFAYQVLFS